MPDSLTIIGIDSLDPHILVKYKDKLPNFSQLMDGSPSFISTNTLFPVDTIPAWMSIYTGLDPGHHGLLYVYDVFDPTLSDLQKLDISRIQGRTFWDVASREGYRTVLVYPLLAYPAWEVNGVMISKSPVEHRMQALIRERDVTFYPDSIGDTYPIPKKMPDLWGGFPGIHNLETWADLGKDILATEKQIGLELYRKERWQLFFIYFSVLDIIQHRLWRFFDDRDPTYPGSSHLQWVILDYYRLFDDLLGEFMRENPESGFIVLSDHGHRSRPIKTVNINECLRREHYLVTKGDQRPAKIDIKRHILDLATTLNIEHWLIRIVASNKKITQISKSIYSSAGLIDTDHSIAYLSNFAGIKSYPYGGLEINHELVSSAEYGKIRENLIEYLSTLKTQEGTPLMTWIKKREDLYSGSYTEELYPDIVFKIQDDYGVGWDLYTQDFGRSYDHKVASGGHGKDAVFLMKNIDRKVVRSDVGLLDIAPTILDLLGIDRQSLKCDGSSILEGPNAG